MVYVAKGATKKYHRSSCRVLKDFRKKGKVRKYYLSDAKRKGFVACPKCGAPSLIRQEGCDTCVSCAYSKCS